MAMIRGSYYYFYYYYYHPNLTTTPLPLPRGIKQQERRVGDH